MIDIDTAYIPKYYQPPLIEIIPISVKVDSSHEGFSPENLIDNNPYQSKSEKGTRYVVPNYPRWIIFDFIEITEINKIAVNTFGWDEGYSRGSVVRDHPRSHDKPL